MQLNLRMAALVAVVFGLLASTWIGPNAAARAADSQTTQAEPVQVSARDLLRAVKDSKLDQGLRMEAALELRERGRLDAKVAKDLTKALEGFEKAFGKHSQRELQALEKQIAKVGKAVVSKRLGRSEKSEVEELQDLVQSTSRLSDLTKNQIVEISDPAIERLRSLLQPTLGQVLERDPKLSERIEALREAQADARAWSDLLVDLASDTRDDAVPSVDLEAAGLDPAELERLLEQFAGLSGPFERRDLAVMVANRELVGQLDAQELAGVEAGNWLRMLAGLPALRGNWKLTQACRDHSKDMVEHKFFAHESPVKGKHSFSDRASNFGASASAENIAAGQATGAGAIGAWWHSPGHHRNLMGGHAGVGLGRFEQHWTQLFQ